MARRYDLQAWRRYRRAYLQQHPLCAMCQAEGRRRIATPIDHVGALNVGGDSQSWDNLDPLCDRHYATKIRITA